jgi:hypothetical protein
MNGSRTLGGGWLRLLLAAALAAAVVVQGCRLVGYDATLKAIAVAPAHPTIALVVTQQLTATGRYSDDTERDVTADVAWSSSAPTVASVSGGGLVTPAQAGTAVITAALDGVSGGTTLVVTDAQLQSIEVTAASLSIANGTRAQLTATGHFDDQSAQDLTAQAAWTSSEPSVTVGDLPGSKGLVQSTALGATTATLTATFDAVSGSTTLTVNAVSLDSLAVAPAAATVTVLRYQQFTATGTFSDASSQDLTGEVAWGSSNPTIATVSAGGRARGESASPTSVAITATSSALLGSVSGSAQLTVQAASGGY